MWSLTNLLCAAAVPQAAMTTVSIDRLHDWEDLLLRMVKYISWYLSQDLDMFSFVKSGCARPPGLAIILLHVCNLPLCAKCQINMCVVVGQGNSAAAVLRYVAA